MPNRLVTVFVVILGLAASALAAAVASASPARTAGTSLGLVAYSTPKTVMGKIIQAWQQTPDGDGVSFSQSYGASTDQARAVANGLERRPRLPLDGRRRQPPRGRGPRRLEVEPAVVQRHRAPTRSSSSPSATATPSTSRAGTTSSAGRPGADAEPVQLRLGEVEHPRRLRRAAPPREDRPAGDGLRQEALPARGRAGHVGPQRDEHVPLRQGRRPASPTRARRSRRARRARTSST